MAGRAARVRKVRIFGGVCFLFAFDLPLIFSVEWNQQRTGSPATWSAVSSNITITALATFFFFPEFPKLPSRKKMWFLFDRLQTVSHRTVVLAREIIGKNGEYFVSIFLWLHAFRAAGLSRRSSIGFAAFCRSGASHI
jgi:hypothetical protein